MDVEVKEDLYRAQSAFVKKLKQIAVRHDVVILMVAHPKKTREQLENDDVSGSSDITNRADVVLTYSSNADKHEAVSYTHLSCKGKHIFMGMISPEPPSARQRRGRFLI